MKKLTKTNLKYKKQSLKIGDLVEIIAGNDKNVIVILALISHPSQPPWPVGRCWDPLKKSLRSCKSSKYGMSLGTVQETQTSKQSLRV